MQDAGNGGGAGQFSAGIADFFQHQRSAAPAHLTQRALHTGDGRGEGVHNAAVVIAKQGDVPSHCQIVPDAVGVYPAGHHVIKGKDGADPFGNQLLSAPVAALFIPVAVQGQIVVVQYARIVQGTLIPMQPGLGIQAGDRAADHPEYVNQPISSRVKTKIGAHILRLEQTAAYMQNGSITLKAESDGPVTLRIRVPRYLEQPRFTCNGQSVQPAMEKGYALFEVDGTAEIRIEGRVIARFVAANRRVRALAGRVAVMKGPFVYCLEQTDNGENLPALSVLPGAAIEEQPPEPGLPGRLPTLQPTGRRLTATVADDAALYGAPAFAEEPVTLKAVPYALWCNRTPGEMQVWIRAQA